MRIEAVAELAVHLLQFLMRKFQETIDQAEFIHHLQRRGMHGVAAEIPEEIGMFFQHQGLDAGATQQISEHHAGRTAADDAAARAALRRPFRASTRIHIHMSTAPLKDARRRKLLNSDTLPSR